MIYSFIFIYTYIQLFMHVYIVKKFARMTSYSSGYADTAHLGQHGREADLPASEGMEDPTRLGPHVILI